MTARVCVRVREQLSVHQLVSIACSATIDRLSLLHVYLHHSSALQWLHTLLCRVRQLILNASHLRSVLVYIYIFLERFRLSLSRSSVVISPHIPTYTTPYGSTKNKKKKRSWFSAGFVCLSHSLKIHNLSRLNVCTQHSYRIHADGCIVYIHIYSLSQLLLLLFSIHFVVLWMRLNIWIMIMILKYRVCTRSQCLSEIFCDCYVPSVSMGFMSVDKWQCCR